LNVCKRLVAVLLIAKVLLAEAFCIMIL